MNSRLLRLSESRCSGPYVPYDQLSGPLAAFTSSGTSGAFEQLTGRLGNRRDFKASLRGALAGLVWVFAAVACVRDA